VFRFADSRIDEASGIGVGIASPGVVYVQNDSGDAARFFAVDASTGATLAVYSVPGAQNVDWEDLAVARDARGDFPHAFAARLDSVDFPLAYLPPSLGGALRNPAWYHNLVANPRVELQDAAVRRELTAREVHGAEKELWWERCVAAFPEYADLQANSERQIPVFVLE